MLDADRSYVEWKQWRPESFGAFSAEDAAYFAAETSIRPGTASARLLEIGFGNGSLLGWARSRGAEVLGIESNPILVERACRFLGAKRAFPSIEDESLAAERGNITHVVAFDVIEHIAFEDIGRLLIHCRSLLAPQGRIVLRFPNGDSPFGRIVQHGDPTHLTIIGRGKLEYLARATGLRVADIRAPALPLSGGGPRRAIKRLLLRGGRAIVEPLVGMLYFGGRTIPLDSNYVATLVHDR
jgi:2-polyprenyl-3-methyl-5-hydroxy-6-metoxy-1,4-benzoquinol methylase